MFSMKCLWTGLMPSLSFPSTCRKDSKPPSPLHLSFDPGNRDLRYFLVTISLEPSKISPSTWHIFTRATERCWADLAVSMHILGYSDQKKLEHSLTLKCNQLIKIASHYQQNNKSLTKKSCRSFSRFRKNQNGNPKVVGSILNTGRKWLRCPWTSEVKSSNVTCS